MSQNKIDLKLEPKVSKTFLRKPKITPKTKVKAKPKIALKSPKPNLTLIPKTSIPQLVLDDNDEEEGESIWDFFPDEILLSIGYELSYNELITIRLCSKRCLRVFSDATLITLTTRQKNTIKKMLGAEAYQYKRSLVEFDPGCVISCGVGTGKTVIALNAIRKFLDEKKVKKILICASRMLFPIWKKAFKQWCRGLPELYEFMVGTEDVNKKKSSCLDDKKIVLTKTGLNCGIVKGGRYNDQLCLSKLDQMKPQTMSSSNWVLWNLCEVKWDLIICDDMNQCPEFIRVLQANLKMRLKHTFRLFSLNASNRRVGNLVNYGVDEELPDKPELTVNLYSFFKGDQGNIYRKIKEILSASESETKFGIYDNGSTFYGFPRLKYDEIREIIFDDYENLDKAGNSAAKCQKMNGFGKDFNSLFSGKKADLTRGHNLYPQEVNYVYRASYDSYSKKISLGLSNLYQALGRCHRTFSPYREVNMNIFVIYNNNHGLEKFKYFFSEYFICKNDNFSRIAKRITGMRDGGKIQKPRKEISGFAGSSKNTIEISEYLSFPKFNSIEIRNEGTMNEDEFRYNKHVFRLKESS
jgi:hypothetical protein